MTTPESLASPDTAEETTGPVKLRPGLSSAWPTRLVLLALMVVVGSTITSAMRHTSPTFDEIVLIAGGARGYETGKFDLAPDHPPLMQYLYGLPVYLSGPQYPDESNIAPEVMGTMGYRYDYAQHFFWRVGNDPERIAFLGRLPAVVCALGLIMLLYGTIGSAYGRTAGLLAAGLVAFLPDVLAHGGVAYNDLPLALAFFAALWAVDSAARRPTVATGALAGALVGLAAAVKISGLALLPAAVVLIAVEATVRRADRRWLRRLVPALGVAAVAAYTTIVIVYAGDVTLSGLRYAVAFRAQHMANGHGAGAFLLGDTSATGWWYFFPVAFLFKTSVGLHMLTAVALAGLLATLRREPGRLLRTRLRAPLVGGIIFGAALLSSNLNIGFRYALPVVPLLCAVTAVGIVKTWPSLPRVARAVTIAAVIWLAAFPLTYYPHFLGFISEYGPGRERNHTVLVDSSLDWGQGLLELRDFMARFETGPVYLSYFGSGVPSRYGIEYVALPSFFPLPQPGEVETAPRFAVISATNLAGVYLPSDPFARFRDMEPIAVLGQSLLVFPLLAE